MRFTIFTHVEHFKEENKYYGYAPYIREMNIWLQYVDEVEVVAPQPPSDPKGEPYKKSDINFTTIPSFHILSFSAFLKAFVKIPIIFFKIIGAMQRADHIHLRCPGNIGLIACIAQMFFPAKPKTAKYAGNWDPEAKQPLSYKLQKWILANTFLTRNMKVLVYGDWPDQSKNIRPFFTASFCESDIKVVDKDLNHPIKFLYVGNLVSGKQPLFALQLVEILLKMNINAELHVYGDGPLRYNLENEAENKDYIHMHGNQPLEILKQVYKHSHFLILASKSEGWPKAVAEAMFFGCIPVATDVSCLPWMLGGGSRGILITDEKAFNWNRVESGDPLERDGRGGERSLPEPIGAGEDNQHVVKGKDLSAGPGQENLNVIDETVERIIGLIQDPEEMKRMSMEAQEWSQVYTLEKFEEEIKKFLVPKDVRL